MPMAEASKAEASEAEASEVEVSEASEVEASGCDAEAWAAIWRSYGFAAPVAAPPKEAIPLIELESSSDELEGGLLVPGVSR